MTPATEPPHWLLGQDAREPIAELTGTNLLTEHLPGRYRFHDLLRAFASEQVAAGQSRVAREAAGSRMLDHYLAVAQQADRAIHPRPLDESGPDEPDVGTPERALHWLETEVPTLLALVAFAADHDQPTHAWQLTRAINRHLRRSRRMVERRNVHRIALAAARRSGDRFGQATTLRHLGMTLDWLGDRPGAKDCLDQAAAIYAELGDVLGQVANHLTYAWILRDGEAPLEHARLAWELVRELDNARVHQGHVLTAMVRQLIRLDRVAEALPMCEQALAHATAVGHLEDQASALRSRGAIEHRLGRPDLAIGWFQRSVAIDRQIGDLNWAARTLDLLGEAYLATGEHVLAARCWREALAIFAEHNHQSRIDTIRAKLAGLPG